MSTYERINRYFNEFSALPDRNVFSPAGFAALAEWAERQPWWGGFAVRYRLGGDWRSTPMADSHLFALNLYGFLNPVLPTGRASGAPCRAARGEFQNSGAIAPNRRVAENTGGEP